MKIRFGQFDDMNIRRCKKDDLKAVFRIELDSFEHPYNKYIFERYLGSDLFLVSENDDRAIGYVIGEERGEEGIIISIAVAPSFRLKGIGTSLLKHVLKRMSADKVMLTVRIGNKEVVEFYRKSGFKVVGVLREYYESGEDGIVMGMLNKG